MSTVVPTGELLLRSIVFTRPIRLVDPPSWVPHIPFAFWLVDALRPRTIVELGTHSGVSYSAFAQAVQVLGLDAATYAVDTWKGDHQAGFYGEDVFKEWSSFHDHHFGAFSRLVRSTFEEALSKFRDGSVDLLHIDGLHTYEAIRQDFESWIPKLSNRAVVLMHDTNVREADFGVWRFWPELMARYPGFAFLHGHGLGVVGVGHGLPSDVRWLVEDVNSHGQIAVTVREFFATLGEGLLQQLRESGHMHERVQMVGRLAEQDALVAHLTAEANQVSAAHAHERAQMVGRLAEQDAQVARLTAEATQIAAAQKESEAAFRQVQVLATDLVHQLSAASVALDRAHTEAHAQGQQISTMATELASVREDLRTALDETEAACNRTQTLERELVATRDQVRTVQRKADAERDRAGSLENEITTLKRRLDRASKRRGILNRRLRKVREATSRLNRQRAVEAAQQRKLAKALKQVYSSRSWRWTAPVRRALSEADGSGPISFVARNLRGWARTARTLLSPSRLRDVREIARSGLFDKAFYRRTYPDVGRVTVPLIVHYVLTGAREGRRPHPLFDGKYYLAHNKDVRKSGANPLLHFVRQGAAAGRDPHPLFSIRYYLAANPDARASGLNPLSHYTKLGSQKGLTPHPLFDPAFYRDRYADVQAPGIDPLAHFVEQGARDGRSPHPLFDAKFYLKECRDVPRVNANPLLHYLEDGLQESHDPHPLFQNGFYLGQIADVQQSGITALQHFVESGVHEGLQPNPLFDPIWYLKNYPDVVKSGQNPLVYYATQGWKEGHDPSPGFSTSYYLKANGDVGAAGVCPLEHYLRHGRREGRLPRNGTTPDDWLVPDVPPQVTLSVHRASATPGPFTPNAPKAAADSTLGTVVCLSHVIPWPPRAGNEYRIHRMLVHLRKSGYRIMLVMAPLSPETVDDARWEALAAAYGNVIHCERDGHVRYRLDEFPDVLADLNGDKTRNYAALLGEVHSMTLAAREMLQIDRSFCHDVLVTTLLQLQKSLTPCAVLAEYIWMTRALSLLDPRVLTIIDTHDVFSTYHQKVGAFGVAGWDVPPEEEARRLARAKVIIAIQPEEAQTLRTLAPKREILTVGVDFEVIEDGDWPECPLVFCVGSDNPKNMLGMRDFLKFAWPEILSAVPRARLAVAGSVGKAVPDYAQRVDVLGHIENLDPWYLKARVVVNPAAAGTGLKVKTVEALSRLRPIVTWPNGLEGVPSEMAELVPPAQDWFEFAERVVAWLQATTPAFDATAAVSIRRMLSADHVYGALQARLARFFDLHRSQKR